jgi:ferric-dicitrate binding protein FerR (iron transport regulator)
VKAPVTIQKLTDLLRKRVAGLEAATLPPPPEPARAAAIFAIEQALRERKRASQKQRMYRFGFGAVAAAAAVVVLVAGARVQHGHASSGEAAVSVRATGSGGEAKRADGTPAPFGEDLALGRGSRVMASDVGTVHLAFSTGTEIDLTEKGSLGVTESGATQAFQLDHGTLSAHVAKLGAGQRFLVRTGDAEVEVRGTRFTVSVGPALACAGGVSTKVRVTEGAVVVRGAHGEVRLGPGEAWPACTDAAVAQPPLAATLAAKPTATPAEDVAPKLAVPALDLSASLFPSPSVTPPSSLGDENALYQKALAEKRSGDTGAAVQSFERLLSRYPKSPLAESASAERMRILARDPSSHGRARTAARDYLARFPSGFARTEAETVLSGP